MIDIEVDVYDGLYSLLAKECPGVFFIRGIGQSAVFVPECNDDGGRQLCCH